MGEAAVAREFSRRVFLAASIAVGADPLVAAGRSSISTSSWRERSDLFTEGVASGDPDDNSVILWTRRSFAPHDEGMLLVEVSLDASFGRIVAERSVRIVPAADWTCRVLVGNLRPDTIYFYRFSDREGRGSRVGRTRTAPPKSSTAAAKFAFVCCQNVNQGAQNAYRRMIYEDERAAPADRLGFVLHLGDFIYEVVWYPEDRPQGMYDRKLRDVVRYPSGERIGDFHVPTTLDDYRAVYRAYLRDPDIQDARARWPFVAMWDNHEFSQNGWQGLIEFGGAVRPAQTRKVAANQAWYEFQPARVGRPGGLTLDGFDPPHVVDAPIERYDEDGLGLEANNLAAIRSLTGYRTFHWGTNVEVIITDQHSYRSRDPLDHPEADALSSRDFLDMMPEEAMVILDAGRSFGGGSPPATIRYGDASVNNYLRSAPPQTILGAEQKAWFLDKLSRSQATWKIWGNTLGTLDWRADPQNLPDGMGKPWPGAGFAGFGGGDHGSAYVERAEIYDHVRTRGITGFATIAGDRHSFWAGLSAKALPPERFDPVGVAFVVASLSAPGLVEAREHTLAADHPLRSLYLVDGPGSPHPEPTVNLLLRHGVRSCIEYAASGSLAKAHEMTNTGMSPHLSFVDMGGHGYAVVTAAPEKLEVEFVCLPRPIDRSTSPDGGPVRYRVVHSAALWGVGGHPELVRTHVDGDLGLSG